MSRLPLLCACVLCCAVLSGCAHRGADPAPWSLPPTAESARLAASFAPSDAPLLMWHSVRLSVPGRRLDETFSGALRLEPGNSSLRAVGMGGFGLKAFDLTVTPDSAETHYLNPGLARMRGMSERIAFCLRRMWLTCRPGAGDGFRAADGTEYLYGRKGDVLLEHSFRGGQLVSTKATGPAENWEITYDGYLSGRGVPSSITFTDGRGNYTLWIRLVSQWQEHR